MNLPRATRCAEEMDFGPRDCRRQFMSPGRSGPGGKLERAKRNSADGMRRATGLLRRHGLQRSARDCAAHDAGNADLDMTHHARHNAA
jgi:hypothetical protein